MTFKTLSSHVALRPLARNTPVLQPIPGREADMVANSAGGVSFKLNKWDQLQRFLLIGTEGGSYYATEREITLSGTSVIKDLILENGNKVVDQCVEISQAGRAKNNDYALLVMAMVITHGSNSAKRYAGASLPLVARTGTHILHYVAFCNNLRGFGKILKWAVSNWYNSKDVDYVAYQAIKYQQRDGWSQRDVLRLSHPKAAENDKVRNSTYKYIAKGYQSLTAEDKIPDIIAAFEAAKTAPKNVLIKLITDYRLSHEMIPNEMKSYPEVWEALSQSMGSTALLRNLNKLTAVGLIKPFSEFSKSVVDKLNDVEILKKDRIHPLTVLIAQKQYAQGRGDKGSLIWTPDASIVAGLETTFYSSFRAVEPTNKNIMLALDVSASMNSMASGTPNVTCREISAIMAMVSLRAEKNAMVMGFDHKFRNLEITANDTLKVAMEKTYSRNFGNTDMSLPMETAQREGWKVDGFCIYTDSEINVSKRHPIQALRNYRNSSGIHDAKMVVVGMSVNEFTIADPTDKGSLDICGFDSSAPAFISEFIKGQI